MNLPAWCGHSVLLSTLRFLCIGTGMVSSTEPNTVLWNPPIAPNVFTMKTKMDYPSQSGSATKTFLTVRFFVEDDSVAIVFPELDNKVYTSFDLQDDTKSYEKAWRVTTNLTQTYNCTYVLGNAFGSAQQFLPYWTIRSLTTNDTQWIFGGETTEKTDSGKSKVTGVMWRKPGYEFNGDVTLYMDAKNEVPVRFVVGGASTISSQRVASSLSAVTFLVQGFNDDRAAVRGRARLPADVDSTCVEVGVQMGPVNNRRGLKQSVNSSQETVWQAADLFFTTAAKGALSFGDDETIEDILTLYPHVIFDYTPGPMVSSNPSSFSLLGTAITDVKNQMACGTCWAFSAIGALEAAIYVQSKRTQKVYLSEQYITSCTPATSPPESGVLNGGCDGSFAINAFEFIIQTGGLVPTLSDQPYAGVAGLCIEPVGGFNTHLVGYAHLATADDIKNALTNYGAVSIGIDANSWQSDGSNGIPSVKSVAAQNLAWTYCSAKIETDHAIIIVGWRPCGLPMADGTIEANECWIGLNQWDTTWGADGVILFPIMPPGPADGDANYSDCGILQYASEGLGLAQTVVPILDIKPYETLYSQN